LDQPADPTLAGVGVHLHSLALHEDLQLWTLGSPVKASAVALVRKGAGIGNRCYRTPGPRIPSA